MIIKITGIIFIVTSCGFLGFKVAANYKTEEKQLRTLIMLLEYMMSDLRYRITPLPQLCRQASELFHDPVGYTFLNFSIELNKQKYADPAQCMENILEKCNGLSPITLAQMRQLGNTIGHFDVDGQLNAIKTVSEECKRNLNLLRENKENRLRSYQTLGICAGAALAILFV